MVLDAFFLSFKLILKSQKDKVKFNMLIIFFWYCLLFIGISLFWEALGIP